MHGIHVHAATRKRAWIAPVDRKTAIKVLSGGLVLLASAPRLRPIAVKADHDGT
jgi:hypothetical protein